jgi:hemerythrin-like metal-binding protein
MTNALTTALLGFPWEAILFGVVGATLLGFLTFVQPGWVARPGPRRRLEDTNWPAAQPVQDPSLAALEWDHRFDCGDWLIDNQHRHLFHLSNRLALAVSRCDPAETASLFQAFLPQVVQHFRDEEDLMKCLRFSGLPAHTQSHEALVMEACRHQDALEQGRLDAPSFLAFLSGDLVQGHLLNLDLDFAPLLRAAAQRAFPPDQAPGGFPPAS